MIGGPELEAELRPALPRRTSVAAALLRVGIDARQYRDDSQRIVLLRPERIAPQADLGSRAADIEISQMADIDRYFQSAATAGSLFFRQPREVHIESFDQKSRFKPGYTWLLAQPSPSGQQNRRRFVHSLATLDAQVMVDGGWVLSMGQEAAIRDLVAAYRALPAARFQPVGNGQGADAAQPVTFRCGTYGGRTYLYAVNDAPFATTARVHVEAGPACRIEELSGTRKIEPLRPDAASGLYWEVKLEPYDLVAVRLSEPGVQCSNPQVAWPGAVETALGSQIRRLGARAAALRNPPPLDVVANPGFEQPPAGNGQIPDWAVTARKGVSIQLDKTQKHGGRQSVKIASTGPVACLVSRPLAVPSTGRLAVSVWLRVADAARQPPLRLALEGKLHGRDYYRFAPVGLTPGAGQPAVADPAGMGAVCFSGGRPAAGRAHAASRTIRPDGPRRGVGQRRAGLLPGLQPVRDGRAIEDHHAGRREAAERPDRRLSSLAGGLLAAVPGRERAAAGRSRAIRDGRREAASRRREAARSQRFVEPHERPSARFSAALMLRWHLGPLLIRISVGGPKFSSECPDLPQSRH